MGTIADKINLLLNTKAAIKNAIIAKGQAVADTDPFSAYANKIAAIQTGVTLPTLTNPGTAADLLSGKQLIDGDGNVVNGSIASRTASDLTASGATVTVPAGHYAAQASKSVATATQATPSISDPTSSGDITASVTQTAGYVAAGTKSTTKRLPTQAAQTITPGTADQTIASGRYLTGAQTILGDANLVAENIKSGVSIFGVAGSLPGTTLYYETDNVMYLYSDYEMKIDISGLSLSGDNRILYAYFLFHLDRSFDHAEPDELLILLRSISSTGVGVYRFALNYYLSSVDRTVDSAFSTLRDDPSTPTYDPTADMLMHTDGNYLTLALPTDGSFGIFNGKGINQLILAWSVNGPPIDESGRMPTFDLSTPDNTEYSFRYSSSDGYYVSYNDGVASSWAMSKITFTLPKTATITFYCINSAESNYDYGLLSNIDTALAESAAADTTGVYKSFKGISSTTETAVTYTMPAGEHFVYVKFIKNGSGDENDDMFKFRIEIS